MGSRAFSIRSRVRDLSACSLRLPGALQARLALRPGLTDEALRDAVLEACALVDEERPGQAGS